MRRITSRFVMLIATAAVAPLVIYGLVSIRTLAGGTEESVRLGNKRVAEQVASQLKLYIDNNARILRKIVSDKSIVRVEFYKNQAVVASGSGHMLQETPKNNDHDF